MPKQDEVSLAGSVLSKGNPFAHGEASRELIANMLPPEHRDFLMGRLESFLSPYFEAALSLAADVLSTGPSLTDSQREAVAAAATLLRSYEAHHAAKPDTEKAQRNGVMAARLERAFGMPKVAPKAIEAVAVQGELSVADHMLGLLKGQHPNGTSWAKLSNAIDFAHEDAEPGETLPWDELRERGAVVEDEDGNVFAAETVVADTAVPAIAWPIIR
jgi:hypothetical protein